MSAVLRGLPLECGDPEVVTVLDQPPEDGAYALVIAALGGMPADQANLLLDRFAPGRATATRLLALCDSRDDSVRAAGRGLRNFVARGTASTTAELRPTFEKLLGGPIGGVGQYFDAAADPVDFEVTRSDRKDPILRFATSFAKAAGANERLRDQFTVATDELITNALYDAPHDEKGRPRFADRDRDDVVELAPGEAVRVRFIADASRCAVSVADPFGTILPAQIGDRLVQYFTGATARPSEGRGGAGLGLRMVLDSFSHVVANLSVRRRTEMIGILHLDRAYRDFARAARSFNLFVEP